MNIITAINNEKIYQELNKKNNINIVSKDIQYKEGILEVLEKNKNIQIIIINENILGQIQITDLIKKIKETSQKTEIIFLLNKKEIKKEEFLIKNNIKYIYLEKINVNKILEEINKEKNIIGILGNRGSGKTITTLILSETLSFKKNKKILIIEDNIENCSIKNIYKKENKKELIIKIKNNLYLLNTNKLLIENKKNKIKIINEINKIKNKYDYIFIDMKDFYSYKTYNRIINKYLLILESNIVEINKTKKFIKKNSVIKIILNNYNENSISEKILKNIFNNKIEILETLKNNNKYNLLLNNNFNINLLDYKTKNKFINIIEKI